MRVLFGIILGAVLVIGAAYVHDSMYASPTATPPARPIVNWDVASEATGNTARRVRTEFNRLVGR